MVKMFLVLRDEILIFWYSFWGCNIKRNIEIKFVMKFISFSSLKSEILNQFCKKKTSGPC